MRSFAVTYVREWNEDSDTIFYSIFDLQQFEGGSRVYTKKRTH